MKRNILIATAALALIATPALAQQDFPNRPLRTLTALSAGGSSDVFMRVVGEVFQRKTGQPIIVENRPGGALNIGGQACADAPPDGYTICHLPIETLSYNQFMFKKLAYNPREFEPISNMYFVTSVLVVSSTLNVNSLEELAALSKVKPGTLSYGSPAVPLAYFMEVWKKETGADMVRLPYRGGADAATAILNGSMPIAFSGLANFVPHIQAGSMKALAVDSEQRSPLLPNVPTLRELGYKGLLSTAYFGIVAPKGTPRGYIEKINKIMVEIAGDKAFAERNMINLGLVPILNTPEQFAAFLKENWVTAEQIVKAAGLEPQ